VSVVSDESPSNYGQPVTFTATITAANGLLKRRNGAKPEDVTGSVTWSANLLERNLGHSRMRSNQSYFYAGDLYFGRSRHSNL